MEPVAPSSPRATASVRAAHPVLDRTFAAVLLDMDGTLISSTDAVVRSWTRLAEEFSVPAERFRGFEGLHGIPARAVVEMLLGDRDDAERRRAADRIDAIELEDTDGVAVLPGAAEALAALAPDRCAIVTSCTRDLARVRLAATGLPAPRAVVTADDVSSGKPDPEPFLAGAALLGVAPQDCVVVEDAAAGIAAAHAAGAATIALTTTHADGHADAGLVVADLAAVRFRVTTDGVRVELR